jgi:hypothetical protein
MQRSGQLFKNGFNYRQCNTHVFSRNYLLSVRRSSEKTITLDRAQVTTIFIAIPVVQPTLRNAMTRMISSFLMHRYFSGLLA